MQWHLKLRGRKKSGKRYMKSYKKKRHQRGRDFLPAVLATARRITKRIRGGNSKSITTGVETVNISTKEGVKKAKVISVLENPANPQFIRRNIVTKGALVDTELGKARVTSRPGQAGSVDAVLVEEKK